MVAEHKEVNGMELSLDAERLFAVVLESLDAPQ